MLREVLLYQLEESTCCQRPLGGSAGMHDQGWLYLPAAASLQPRDQKCGESPGDFAAMQACAFRAHCCVSLQQWSRTEERRFVQMAAGKPHETGADATYAGRLADAVQGCRHIWGL